MMVPEWSHCCFLFASMFNTLRNFQGCMLEILQHGPISDPFVLAEQEKLLHISPKMVIKVTELPRMTFVMH